MTPREVETIAIPKPLRIRGNSPEPEYLRKPGLLILWIFLITSGNKEFNMNYKEKILMTHWYGNPLMELT